ncbi:MAG: hypothetical protein WCO89_00125 [Syntrophus sp. (in: bacteria)]
MRIVIDMNPDESREITLDEISEILDEFVHRIITLGYKDGEFIDKNYGDISVKFNTKENEQSSLEEIREITQHIRSFRERLHKENETQTKEGVDALPGIFRHRRMDDELRTAELALRNTETEIMFEEADEWPKHRHPTDNF